MTEWNARDYHHRAALQQWLAEDSLATLDLDGAGAVLDVGCGDGRITAEIAERLPGARVVGIDPSTRMIDYAQAEYGRGNLTFEVAEAHSLPFRSEFDLAVSFNALHWELRLADAVRRLREALRPGGRAFLQFVGHGPRTSLEHAIEETRRSGAWSPWFDGFQQPYIHPTPEEFRSLCEAAGFAVASQDMPTREWDFGSREAFTKWSEATMVNWTSRLPQDRQDAFISDVLDRYGSNVFTFYQMRTSLLVRQ